MTQQQGNRFFFNVDWITVLIYISLCAIGFTNIYASIPHPENATAFDFTSSYGKQLIYIVSGLILGFPFYYSMEDCLTYSHHLFMALHCYSWLQCLLLVEM